MAVGNANQFGGTWTQDKLQLLRGYLERYTTALKRQHFNLVYVDAFAGTGYVDIGSQADSQEVPLLVAEVDVDTAGMLKGSTRLALEVDDRPFDQFVFVEQNPAYAAELQFLQSEFPDRDIQVQTADANVFLPAWCDRQNSNLGVPWSRQRAVIFLDPFATEVDWNTVWSIAETKSVDLWILFPLSALTRIMPTERQPDEEWAAVLDRVFGGPEWRDALYSTQVQPTLFGEDQILTVRSDQQAIVDAYLAKLRTVFEAVAPTPRWFLNSRKSPQFALMFAASNPAGAPIAVRIADHLLRNW
ncbi:MAG: three-Cys-motif partner protein TcmP [Chloroflexi bacterium]|nr:three-Cys-motif partner protein TcmP [Chloroflexota bacterium]